MNTKLEAFPKALLLSFITAQVLYVEGRGAWCAADDQGGDRVRGEDEEWRGALLMIRVEEGGG
jgi:hypothetical protein